MYTVQSLRPNGLFQCLFQGLLQGLFQGMFQGSLQGPSPKYIVQGSELNSNVQGSFQALMSNVKVIMFNVKGPVSNTRY